MESAPDKQPPVRTQPRLLLYQAVPPVYELLENAPQASVDFTIPIHPEDQGQVYVASWFLNYRLEGQAYKGTVDANADSITFNLDMPDKEGCYQYTMFVTPEGNYNRSTHLPRELQDATMVSWWVLIAGPNSEEPSLKDCPSLATDSTD